MPYKSNKDLPQDVREGLPDEAQSAYRDAYNTACGPGDDPDNESAMKAGWSAVERDYKWQNDQWVRRQQQDEDNQDSPGYQNKGNSSERAEIDARGGSQENTSFGGKGGSDDPRESQTNQQQQAPPRGAANAQRETQSGTLRKGISGEEEEPEVQSNEPEDKDCD